MQLPLSPKGVLSWLRLGWTAWDCALHEQQEELAGAWSPELCLGCDSGGANALRSQNI